MILLKKIFATITMVAFFTPIELEKKIILDNKVEILMPKEWKPMSEELIKRKYPGTHPPQLVYSDVSGGISLAFNHTDTKASPAILEKHREVLKTSLENAYPHSLWEEEGIKEINGKKVGFFRLITDTPNDRIYNYIVFTDLDGKLLICSFNCVEKKLKDWKPVAQEIMNSMSFR